MGHLTMAFHLAGPLMDSASSSSSQSGGSLEDADWCQVKETLTMLYLSSAQIESSMHEDTTVFQAAFRCHGLYCDSITIN